MDDEDRHHYRRLLHEACLESDIAVHAFALMDNHVHLLLTPPRRKHWRLQCVLLAKATFSSSTTVMVGRAPCGKVGSSPAWSNLIVMH
ncbi:transposase [Stenotrophomonas acidaminiphila]|uniref:transposase n=1 Tax=Stenotrophomonas acidaminiphila TaxID=128780 RepID=UPI0028AB652F|nr:transposase [Stenotrophomonas acidaminiphila]